MRILVIAPHPDDETIGCGGSLLLEHRRGNAADVIFLTSGELGLKHLPVDEARRVRQEEARGAAAILGLASLRFLDLPDWGCEEHVEQAAELIAPLIDAARPERVYVPHAEDEHPDHQAAIPILRAAVRRAGLPWPLVLGYEVWTPLARHDHVEDISEVMDLKVRALRCYRSQLASFRYDNAITGLNQYRGELGAHCRYAEVFRTVEAS